MKRWNRGTLAAMALGLMISLASFGVTAQEVAPINVNTASAELLAELPGIGAAKAQAIIEEREANGPFATATDLARVSGIGDATVAGLQDQVSF